MIDETAPQPSADISKIKAPDISSISLQTRSRSKQEKELYDVHTAGLRQDIAERKRYAGRTFLLSCSWIFAVFAILLMQGFGVKLHFFLPERVILAAIGTTTVNILGVFFIVVRYLFQDKSH